MNKSIYLLFYSDEYSDKFVAAYSNEQQAKVEVVLLNRTTYRDRYSIKEVDLV